MADEAASQRSGVPWVEQRAPGEVRHRCSRSIRTTGRTIRARSGHAPPRARPSSGRRVRTPGAAVGLWASAGARSGGGGMRSPAWVRRGTRSRVRRVRGPGAGDDLSGDGCDLRGGVGAGRGIFGANGCELGGAVRGCGGLLRRIAR